MRYVLKEILYPSIHRPCRCRTNGVTLCQTTAQTLPSGDDASQTQYLGLNSRRYATETDADQLNARGATQAALGGRRWGRFGRVIPCPLTGSHNFVVELNL